MTNPTRVADGMSSHVNYTVNTNTTNEKYSYSQSVVVRRYNDFLWLHDILTDEYPYAVIPPMPEKNTMNRFEIEFVETRRASLQSFLREIAADPLLKESKRLRTFLTADDEKFAEEKAETKSSLKDSLKGNPMEAGMKLLKLMKPDIDKDMPLKWLARYHAAGIMAVGFSLWDEEMDEKHLREKLPVFYQNLF